MNTTHSISDIPIPPYTVIGSNTGGGQEQTGNDISLVFLNRDRFYNPVEIIEICKKIKWKEIIFIETGNISHEKSSMALQHPNIRFLIFNNPTPTGSKINIAVQESRSKQVLVVWNNLSSLHIDDFIQGENEVISTIELAVRYGNSIPAVTAPVRESKAVKFIPIEDYEKGFPNLFPGFYVGLYNKKLFQELGGFDPLIRNEFWQKIDFGFRVFMWGYNMSHHSESQATFVADFDSENTSYDSSYCRFFLKTLAVRYNGYGAELPFSRFFSYLRKSGLGPFTGFSEFRAMRKWVKLNMYRFRYDAKSVIDLWEDLIS